MYPSKHRSISKTGSSISAVTLKKIENYYYNQPLYGEFNSYLIVIVCSNGPSKQLKDKPSFLTVLMHIRQTRTNRDTQINGGQSPP